MELFRGKKNHIYFHKQKRYINRQFMNKTALSEIKPHKSKNTVCSCKPIGPCPTWISKEKDIPRSFVSRSTFKQKKLFFMKMDNLNDTIDFSCFPKKRKSNEKGFGFPTKETPSLFFPDTLVSKRRNNLISTYTAGFNVSSQYEEPRNVRSNSFGITNGFSQKHDSRLLKGKDRSPKIEQFKGELKGIKAAVLIKQKERQFKEMKKATKAIIKKTYLFQEQKFEDQTLPRGCSPWEVSPRLDISIKL